MSAPGQVWDEVVGAYTWLKQLALGEFTENRPTSVVISDMLVSMTVPGAVIVTSARDLAAVCLRLGRRYDRPFRDEQANAPPEWQEWVILFASAMGVFGPLICAAAGALVGGLIGSEVAALIRAVSLLLIGKGGTSLVKMVGFLENLTKGNIVKLLAKIRFVEYAEPTVGKLKEFLHGVQNLIQKARGLLSRVEFTRQAQHLLAQLDRLERQFYAVQTHCAQQLPLALAKLDEALQKLLKDSLPPTHQSAYAGISAPKPSTIELQKQRISSGIGEPPKVLPMLRDGASATGDAAHGGKLSEQQAPLPESGNVHRKDPQDMSRVEKGIFGEKISDDFMRERGYTSLLSAHRQKRLLEQKPTGRGIDGVYKKPPGEPPPPYVVTETKFRTGGNATPSDLSMTKRSGKQMSGRWITNRLSQAVGDDEKVLKIREAGYESWLMSVDESGKVTSIIKLDVNGSALLDAFGKPIKISTK